MKKNYENHFRITTLGFTLIEVLAVVIILGVLAAIIIPVTAGIIDSSREKAYNEQINRLENLTYTYSIQENITNKTGSVSFLDLVNSGLLTEEPSNPKTGEKLLGCVTYEWIDSKNQYEFKYSEDCTQVVVGDCAVWDSWENRATPEVDFEFDSTSGRIIAYLGDDKDIVIPCEINGVSVTKITHNVKFDDNGIIEDENFNEMMAMISDSERSRYGFMDINVPDAVDTGGVAGVGITSVILNNNITEIGYAAFFNNNLTNIEIPRSVIDISVMGFGANQISEIHVPATVETVSSMSFASNPIKKITIKDGVQKIYTDSFMTETPGFTMEIPSSVSLIPSSNLTRYNFSEITETEFEIQKSNAVYVDLKGMCAEDSEYAYGFTNRYVWLAVVSNFDRVYKISSDPNLSCSLNEIYVSDTD